MDKETQQLVSRIKARCEAERIAPSTFGNRYFQNSRLLERVESGTLSLSNFRKLEKILAEGPPTPQPEQAGV